MKIRVLLLSVVVLVAGCDVPGTPQQTSNSKAEVETLFDVDGYRVYRFTDSGKYVYFVLPARGDRGSQAQAIWSTSESCGKNCTKTIPHQVATVMEQR